MVVELTEGNKYEEEYQALKEFLLDIDCLSPLNEWTSQFNMFDILKITKSEIRHSNMLAWLMNPKENHGFGDGVIKGIIQYVTGNFDGINVFDNLLMDFNNFSIHREWRHIDILAVSDEENFVLCIENKIDAKEHDNQLNRYKKIVDETFPEYRKIFLLLSPEGMESSDMEHWCPMSYIDLINIIEQEKKKARLLPDAALLIDNYLEAVRRDVVGDEKLAQICVEIYNKHQKALDLIFENKPDKISELTAIILAWAKEKTENKELSVSLDNCSKTYTRFKTERMSLVLPDKEEANSGWNTKNNYFYEIINDGDKFYIQFALSSKNLTDKLREKCDQINKFKPSRMQRENWQWRIHFKTRNTKVPDELDEEKIFKALNEKFEEIKAFEQEVFVTVGKME